MKWIVVDGRIAPRSGLAAKHSIDTGAGVIDADYRGEVKVLLFNFSDVDFTSESCPCNKWISPSFLVMMLMRAWMGYNSQGRWSYCSTCPGEGMLERFSLISVSSCFGSLTLQFRFTHPKSWSSNNWKRVFAVREDLEALGREAIWEGFGNLDGMIYGIFV